MIPSLSPPVVEALDSRAALIEGRLWLQIYLEAGEGL